MVLRPAGWDRTPAASYTDDVFLGSWEELSEAMMTSRSTLMRQSSPHHIHTSTSVNCFHHVCQTGLPPSKATPAGARRLYTEFVVLQIKHCS